MTPSSITFGETLRIKMTLHRDKYFKSFKKGRFNTKSGAKCMQMLENLHHLLYKPQLNQFENVKLLAHYF